MDESRKLKELLNDTRLINRLHSDNYKEFLLKIVNSGYLEAFRKCFEFLEIKLEKYKSYFKSYTDHSINHSSWVLKYTSWITPIEEIRNMADDEVYVLAMGAMLHDVGMSLDYEEINCDITGFSYEDIAVYIRNNHHILSDYYITNNWELVFIPNKNIAKAIGLVAQGHRRVNLATYSNNYPVKSGAIGIRVKYLAVLIRIADSIHIGQDRGINPNNIDNSESKQHHKSELSTEYIFVDQKEITIKAICDDRELYYFLVKKYDEISEIIKNCQLLLKKTEGTLDVLAVKTDIEAQGFEDINIKFKLDGNNSFQLLIGKHLYTNKFISFRECIANAIDACNNKTIIVPNYQPLISVILSRNNVIVNDNGYGMTKDDIENSFAKLGKSKKINSIGHFGIGVASYFLVCNNFEVQTVSNDTNIKSKFTVTNNFGEYFYFYDNCAIEEGTQITFNLDTELNNQEIYDYLNICFQFISVPIYINNILISQKNFFDYITNTSHLDKFSYKSSSEFYDINVSFGKGLLNIYNNYIYVQFIESDLIGFINIKDSCNVSLSRNEIRDDSIIKNALVKAKEKLYLDIQAYIKTASKNEQYVLYRELSYISDLPKQFYRIKAYTKRKKKIITWEELIELKSFFANIPKSKRATATESTKIQNFIYEVSPRVINEIKNYFECKYIEIGFSRLKVYFLKNFTKIPFNTRGTNKKKYSKRPRR